MTSDSKRHERLVLTLLDKTDNGLVQWKETADPDIFLVQFPDYAVQISPRTGQLFDSAPVDYTLDIYDAEGAVIDRIDIEDVRDFYNEPRELLAKLYSDARRSARNAAAAIDSILEQLDKTG